MKKEIKKKTMKRKRRAKAPKQEVSNLWIQDDYSIQLSPLNIKSNYRLLNGIWRQFLQLRFYCLWIFTLQIFVASAMVERKARQAISATVASRNIKVEMIISNLVLGHSLMHGGSYYSFISVYNMLFAQILAIAQCTLWAVCFHSKRTSWDKS